MCFLVLPVPVDDKHLANLRSLRQVIVMGRQRPILPAET